MRLLAFSDLHVGHPRNRARLESLRPSPTDWIAVAGDIGETEKHLRLVFETLTPAFARVLWTPGNHELWTLPGEGYRGVAKYEALVALARSYGVVTPEDPYPLWEGEGGPCWVAPTFIGYDYSFRPDHVLAEDAVAWAAEHGLVCTDEALLHPDPYPSRTAWCQARLAITEPRLAEAAATHPMVIINHYPLRYDHAVLPAIPRFSIWCGTRKTERWAERFRVKAAVYGHLHIPRRRDVDGVTFHEVSVGYPQQWRHADLNASLRSILPA